jgi:hypothetical protein
MFNLGQQQWEQHPYPSEDLLNQIEEEKFMKEVEGPVSEGEALLLLTLLLSVVVLVLK